MMIEPSSFSLRKRRPALRACRGEPLEERIALAAVAGVETPLETDVDDVTFLEETDTGRSFPGGVTVTDDYIYTKSEKIPRFVAEPTITTIRSGSWSDPTIWSLGRVPTDGDRVSIAEGALVWYGQQSDARIDGLEINGVLVFLPSVNTRMIVGNLTVMPTGALQIGNPTAPVHRHVTAELIFADQPLDFVQDPKQFGTGLIGLGIVTIHGAEVDNTWLRLAAEPKAGDTSLAVNGSVADWQPGDRLVLPDSRQLKSTQADAFRFGQIPQQWEEVVVERVEGNRVFLTEAVQFDHLGARNTEGQLELLPHVALLSRNVILRSENPQGTRGHTLFTARANVDIEYADFRDLGRTDALRNLDNARVDANGNVIYVGTNQVGRYAVHFHHLLGPKNLENTGHQFKVVGTSIESSRKWGLAVHGTSFGLVEGNVVYDAQGAGIATEDGSEIGNLFRDNIVIRVQGTYVDGKAGTTTGDYGRGGSGFWFRRGGNLVVGNVAADNTYAGFVIDGYNTGAVVLPLFRGAEKDQPGQGVKTELSPVTYLADNEAYGMTPYGVWAAYTSGNNQLDNQPLTYFATLRLWNIFGTGVLAYHTAKTTYEDLLILGNTAAQDRNNSGTRGMDLKDYENRDLIIRNSRIEGVRYGIVAPINDASQPGIERPTVIQNVTLKNYINIYVSPARDDRPSNGAVLEVRNVKFQLRNELPVGPVSPKLVPPPANIYMNGKGENINWAYPSVVRVYDYNQIPGLNFQVFYDEQVASYVMPQTDPQLVYTRNTGVIGSPEAGLTNAENWAKYGIAMAGAVAPPEAGHWRVEINGLVAPFHDSGALAPRVVLVTPWDGAQVVGGYLHVRHNVVGQLPAGAQVYFQLDGGNPFTDLTDGGVFGISPGAHTLYAFIGDADGRVWPGTTLTYKSFVSVASSAAPA